MIKYLNLKIDGQDVDIDSESDFPITFDYQLEDTQDFQKKKSSESIGMKIPATLNNQKLLNNFHNTSVNDYTPKQTFKNIRDIVAEANGVEIFVGKAIPKSATKLGRVPVSYELNCFGNNGDWMLNLKETTIFELIKHISFPFTKITIENSWVFDGTNEALPYVFAPVKYAGWMDEDALNDKNYSLKTMKPSLSIYWILYWGFKSVGYKIQSEFFDSNYFRRMTLPWTYGAFLSSEGTKYEIHKFLAKSDETFWFSGTDLNELVNLNVRDDFPGCFDNNNTIVPTGDYFGDNEHGGGNYMKWKYNTPHYGPLEVNFALSLFYDYKADQSSDVALDVYWYKKDAVTGIVTTIQHDYVFDDEAPALGATYGADVVNLYCSIPINPNDEVWCAVRVYLNPSKTYTVCRIKLKVEEYKLDYFKIPIGGTVNFDSYLTFQKNKFLDLLRGISDLFNLSIQTDPVNKIILIEPTHEYSLTNNLADKIGGYFNKNTLDFTEIEDISQPSVVEYYDDNAREFVFKFKEDGNDGALKIVQDRYKITLASGKYLFSERFKAEKKEFENRYFGPTMHYLVDDFSGVTGQAPQMICLVPENISNTSSSEAQNTFSPKIAFYKGLVTGVGGWKFDGTNKTNLPYLFAVNYKVGGESDPILSYSDERIGVAGSFVLGKGLIKRFFWQRLAIMNNGQWLNTQFKLNNNHIANWFHRERIDIDGELWELVSIKGYNALNDNATKSVLRKWYPISEEQLKNTYPSEISVLTNAVEVIDPPVGSDSNTIDKVFDSQYNPMICLYNDIPKPE